MSRKISLREFQENLVHRLTSAKQGETSRAMLGVRAGKEFWLLDLADSGEIVPLPPLTYVPLTKPWFRGVTNIRGNLYSVVDFAAFQGGEPIPTTADARLLLVGNRLGINSALLVSQALGLRSADNLEPHQEDAQDPRPWVGERFLDSQGRVWNKLLVRNLLMQPLFLDVGL